jgi:4-hydroxybenzoate polyprenyltransferase
MKDSIATEIVNSNFLTTITGYIKIARPDHWFKNVFILPGMLFAIFHDPAYFVLSDIPIAIIGFLSACLLASSNYVLNEIQDAEFDKIHPTKKLRPIPSGLININLAYAEFILLLVTGLLLAWFVNRGFLLTSLVFIFMGWLYNLNPFRLKEIPYLDVISESINNPLRLLMGWFLIIPTLFPSIALLLAYWFLGAFFMATKRYAEYRCINNPNIAAGYRKSFESYSEDSLLTSMFYYVTIFSLFLGVFIIRYHLEIVLAMPLIAAFISYYVKMGLRENSPVQNPEKLYKDPAFLILNFLSVLVFFALLFTEIPVLYEILNIAEPNISPLWEL